MLHFHPTDPLIPPSVQGDHASGLLRVDLTSVGGEIDEYELTIADALRFSQRLRDSAMAMQEFLSGRRATSTPTP